MGNTTTIEYSWHELIRRADPDWERNSNVVVEYEFTARGMPRGPNAHLTHEDGKRVFRARYRERGAYGPDTGITNGLTWGGEALTWAGDELTWGSA